MWNIAQNIPRSRCFWSTLTGVDPYFTIFNMNSLCWKPWPKPQIYPRSVSRALGAKQVARQMQILAGVFFWPPEPDFTNMRFFFLKLAFGNVESLTSWNKNLRHKNCHSTILGIGKIDSMRLEVVFVLESSTRSWSPLLAFPTHAIPFLAGKVSLKSRKMWN